MPTPVILLDIDHSGVHFRYATVDVYSEDQFYRGLMLDAPSVRESLTEIFHGFTDFGDVSVKLDNAGEEIDALYDADPRGDRAVLSRADYESVTRVLYADLVFEPAVAEEPALAPQEEITRTALEATTRWRVTGRVAGISCADQAEVSITFRDPDRLQGKIPELIDDSWNWVDAGSATRSPTDMGKPVNIVFGHAKAVPLRYIRHKTDASDPDEWWYLIGYGVIEGVDAVYRDGVEVEPSEYTVYDGSQSSPYAGYAVVKFEKEQRNFQGGFYTLTADVKGLELGGSAAERNFVRVLQHLLSNTDWGLGQSVDTDSFDTAAAVSDIAALKCDGAVYEQRDVKDVVNDLLFCCRGRLDKDTSGQWRITVDHYDSTSRMTLGYRDGYWENVIRVEERSLTSTGQGIRSVAYHYGWDGKEYRYVTDERVINTDFGEKREEDLPFVEDHTTADRIACYVQQLHRYTDEHIRLVAGLDAQDLDIGDIVTLEIPRFDLSGATYKVIEIEREIDRVDLTLCAYNSAVYTYSAGTLPNDQGGDDDQDWGKTNPPSPTLILVNSSGTYQSADGTTQAYFVIDVDVNMGVHWENFSHVEIGYRDHIAPYPPPTYTDNFIWKANTSLIISGGTIKRFEGRLDELTPGKAYDITARVVNKLNMKSEINTYLANRTAPQDTTAPAGPTWTALGSGTLGVRIDWQAPADVDFSHVGIWRSTSSTFPGGNPNWTVSSRPGEKGSFWDPSATPGTTYYYWIKSYDRTGNASAQIYLGSAVANKVNTAQIANSAVGNAQIGNGQVTSTKTSGATGTFTSSDSKTITVTNGLVTGIV